MVYVQKHDVIDEQARDTVDELTEALLAIHQQLLH